MKNCILASIASFAATFACDFVFHGMIFSGLYEQTASVWRPEEEMMSMMWLMTVNQVLFALAFVWFYSKGYESGKPGIGQGIRFGLYSGVFLAAVYSTGWYAVLPIPFILSIGWSISALVTCLVVGVAVGAVYKKA